MSIKVLRPDDTLGPGTQKLVDMLKKCIERAQECGASTGAVVFIKPDGGTVVQWCCSWATGNELIGAVSCLHFDIAQSRHVPDSERD